jgi:predicted RNA-binding Zn ribbon-like protein
VQVFVNTTDGEERELLPQWLEEQGVAPGAAALRRARETREALRELLIANNERRPPSPEAVGTVERAAERARLTIRFRGGGELVPTARGVDGALGGVLAVAFDAMRAGTWPRLKACRNCHWAFYDYSRNRSAGWCSMQLCGNRLKTRAYRRRQRRRRPRRPESRSAQA